MRRILKATAFLILVSPALPAYAQSTALGYGVNECSELVATYEPSKLSTIFAWSTGYFTGLNVGLMAAGGQTRDLNGLNPNLVVTRLLDHCTRNPQGLIMDGVRKMYFDAPVFSHPDARAQAKPPAKQ